MDHHCLRYFVHRDALEFLLNFPLRSERSYLFLVILFLRVQRTALVYSYPPVRHALLAVMSTREISQKLAQPWCPDDRFRHLDSCYKYTRAALSHTPSVGLFYAASLLFWVSLEHEEPIHTLLDLSRGMFTILTNLNQTVCPTDEWNGMAKIAVRAFSAPIGMVTGRGLPFVPQDVALLWTIIKRAPEIYGCLDCYRCSTIFDQPCFRGCSRAAASYGLFRYLLSINRVEDEADANSECKERLFQQLRRSIDRHLLEYSKQHPSLRDSIRRLVRFDSPQSVWELQADIIVTHEYVFWTCLLQLLSSSGNLDAPVTVLDIDLQSLCKVIYFATGKIKELDPRVLPYCFFLASGFFGLFAFLLRKCEVYEGCSREAQSS